MSNGETKKLTFMASCLDYFGLKEGQTKMQFAQEVKALNEEERKFFKEGLEQNGYEIQQLAS